MKKFIFQSNGILDRIVTPCTIDVNDYDTESQSNQNTIVVKALWDTGSTVTVLSDNIIQKLGLIPSDVSRVSGWDGKVLMTNTYNIDIVLDGVHIEFINAVRGPLTTTDMIIGMDVICQGDLHISHPSITTLLEFSEED